MEVQITASHPPALGGFVAVRPVRRLVILADGTWNKPDQSDRGRRKPSNVTKLERALVPVTDDGVSQLVFYHAGVGTHWTLADRWLGGGLGVGLSRNVLELYRWLVDNYAEGDQLFLFGFSRGAFTVRSLVGLIDRVGLLPKCEAFFMPEAERLYRRRSSDDKVAKFRAEHACRTPVIQFLGVWDTVGALGVPLPLFNWFSRRRFEFHNIRVSPIVHHARQALALDERRRPFRPSIWNEDASEGQSIEQRWFVGVHSNIGGGYDKDGLANVALKWMVGEAESKGLTVDRKFLSFYQPYVGDELRRSFVGFYWLLGSYRRPLREVSPATETVDRSVFVRFREDASYRPRKLLELIAREHLDVNQLAALPKKE